MIRFDRLSESRIKDGRKYCCLNLYSCSETRKPFMKISSVLSQAILSSTSVGVGIALATAISQPAHAAFIKGTCNVADVTAGPVLANASACKNFTGNDTGFEALINNAFGLTGNTWNLLGKSDQSDDPVANINTSGSVQSGNWSLIAPTSVNSPFVVTLKAGDFFSAYLFQGLANITSGTFNVAGVTTTNKKDAGKHADLSHLSVFTSKATAIPTPALLPGLIGLGLGVLRKRQQQGQSAE